MQDENLNQGNQFTYTRETIGAVLLVIATIAALIIANTGLGDKYAALIHKDFTIGIVDQFTFQLSIKKWINDGLMTIFFLVVGLEIKREVLVGELAGRKNAAMPMIAAFGGMLVPAVIFIVLNIHSPGKNGWAIPMATDIAYAVGVLGLIKSRVPVQLKILLTGLAIADDIGAISVIALFYSSDIEWLRIGVAGGIFVTLILLNYFKIKRPLVYVLFGTALWACFLHSGIHPTIAGVLLAMTIPVKPDSSTQQFQDMFERSIAGFKNTDFDELDPFARKEQRKMLEGIREGYKKAYPLLLRMENALQGVNSYFIIPVFAFANAGVRFNISFVELATTNLSLGIILGLVFGKVLGITGFAFLSQKLKIAQLPKNIHWKHIVGMGFLAGIGFTLSLFITNLAFADVKMVQMAKISIFVASLCAAVIGTTILTICGRNKKLQVDE